MTRTERACLVAVLSLLFMTGNGRAVAPPVSRRWVEGELRRVEQLDARAYQATLQGDFALAVRLSREVLTARKVRLGAGHWQTIETGWIVERWERLARFPEMK